jgi:hypothetical protein
MKRVLMAILASTLLCAKCGDNPPKITERTKVNRWVYETMADHYLWNDQLPAMTQSGLETPTQDYFDSHLRYRSNRGVPYQRDTYGDRFSMITYTGEGLPTSRFAGDVDKTFDYGFSVVRIVDNTDNPTMIAFLQVLYVMSGSPAEGKIERGDAFNTVNGQKVTTDNIETLLSSNTIEIEVLNRDVAPVKIERGWYWDQPILVDTVYENLSRKVAYLLYNHFTDSNSDEGDYTGRLKRAFGRYKAEGVRDLVLDLRFNGGGEVRNAQLLASLIAPASSLGDVFMYARDNRERDSPYTLWVEAENADIENLYVLTSDNTASASELIIHTLRPFYGRNLHVIGETTRGKNLGSVTYTDDRFDWEMSPITMRVYDRNKVSGYERGISPDDTGLICSPYNYAGGYFLYLPPLGDYLHEPLLNCAMHRFFGVPENELLTRGTRGSSGVVPATIVDVPDRGLSFGVVTNGE